MYIISIKLTRGLQTNFAYDIIAQEKNKRRKAHVK